VIYTFSRTTPIVRALRNVDLTPLSVEDSATVAVNIDALDQGQYDNLVQTMLDLGYTPVGNPFGTINEARELKFWEIDTRTEELIAMGFTFDGKIFSLSSNAQKYWVGLAVGKDILTYPLVVNTLDDSGTFSISDSMVALQMYATAMGAVKDHLASGTVLKDLVRAAATRDEVLAVEDLR